MHRYVKYGAVLAALGTMAVPVAGISAPSTSAASSQQILFTSDRPLGDEPTDADGVVVRDFDIYVMSATGEGPDALPTQLTNNVAALDSETETYAPVNDLSPVWSPDRTKIAYLGLGTEGDASSQIYLMNADGSSQAQLTNSKASEGSNFEPSFSPDGKQIVFRRGDGTKSHLMTINIATRAEADLPTPTTSGQPDWSPDGKKIVYTRGAGSSQDIYVYSFVDGSDLPLAATASLQESFASWAPNGNQIAYQSGDESVGAGIWVMNADGSNQRALTQPTTYSDKKPVWGNDGSQILFETTRDFAEPASDEETTTEDGPPTDVGGGGGGGGGGSAGGGGGDTTDTITRFTDIYVMSAVDGSGQVRLSTGGSQVEGDVDSGYSDQTPHWQTPMGPGYTPGSTDGGSSTGDDGGSTGAQPSQGQAQGLGNTPAVDPQLGKPLVTGGKACTMVERGTEGTISGTPGNDVVCVLGEGQHAVYTGAGNDTIYTGQGKTTVYSGDGNDTVIGGAGEDTVHGGGGNDVLIGGAGNDILNGAAGNDVVHGSTGADTLLAGTGTDRLYGGAGNDRLVTRHGVGGDWANGGQGTDIARTDHGDGLYGVESRF